MHPEKTACWSRVAPTRLVPGVRQEPGLQAGLAGPEEPGLRSPLGCGKSLPNPLHQNIAWSPVHPPRSPSWGVLCQPGLFCMMLLFPHSLSLHSRPQSLMVQISNTAIATDRICSCWCKFVCCSFISFHSLFSVQERIQKVISL